MSKKFLSADKLQAWLTELNKDQRIMAPVKEGNAIVFRDWDGQTAPDLSKLPNQPPKESVFPQTEILLRFRQEVIPNEEGVRNIELEPTIPSEKCLVFGARPCGTRGFLSFDPVYVNDRIVDPYYKARRDNTVFVTLACDKATNTCFCNWVGSGPTDGRGSDVLLMKVSDGFVAEGVTDKGAALLESSLFEDAGDRAAEAQENQKKVAESLAPAPDLKDAPEKLLANFDAAELWAEVSDKCISCGGCTYFCPTCYCFNITDEADGAVGERIRTWDNCMSAVYTREASGHNPRSAKQNRLKNRVLHKFSYYPTIHNGNIQCCGCGRCIKQCPSSVDIREIVLKAKDYVMEDSGE